MFTPCPLTLGFQNWKKNTALTVACLNGHTATVKVLFDHGVIVDYQNEVRIHVGITNDINLPSSLVSYTYV